ncbi:MAG: ABA4-like family protein [Candidatus Pelagadaptatus aseana]|uniref:ABA4-like family protein n=1 Tax=Candidatus Pelagadaptatus aseana TaxID=3120508 RepID=UPI0039B299F1
MKTLANLFKVSNYTALLGWVVLASLPLWPYGVEMVIMTIVLLLCVVYTYLIFFARKLDQGEPVRGSFWSLKGVMSLFKSPRVVLAGWVHYLAFDLMIGLFIAVDAARVDINHWHLIPTLFLTLMFGPAGLLSYFILKFLMTGEALFTLNF